MGIIKPIITWDSFTSPLKNTNLNNIETNTKDIWCNRSLYKFSSVKYLDANVRDDTMRERTLTKTIVDVTANSRVVLRRFNSIFVVDNYPEYSDIEYNVKYTTQLNSNYANNQAVSFYKTSNSDGTFNYTGDDYDSTQTGLQLIVYTNTSNYTQTIRVDIEIDLANDYPVQGLRGKAIINGLYLVEAL